MPVRYEVGSLPLILGFPYVGLDFPPQISSRLSEAGRENWDADRHLTRAFHGICDDVTRIEARFSRILSDVNTLPGAKSAAGDDRPGMVAQIDSRGARIWRGPPRPHELRSWQSAFFVPYHAALAAQLARVRAMHGYAVVCDVTVMRASPPKSMRTPMLTIATKMTTACNPSLVGDLLSALQSIAPKEAVFDEILEPGWTVRNYGRPKSGVHALQLRVAPEAFLGSNEDPWPYDEERAAKLTPLLAAAIGFLTSWRPDTLRMVQNIYGT